MCLRGGEKHPKSPASTFLTEGTEVCDIQRSDTPLHHQRPQGFGEDHCCIKGYHCVQAHCGGRERSISCTGSVRVRAGEGGGRCASSTGPASTVPCGWCCCHQVNQQRGPRLTPELPHLHHSFSGKGVFLYHRCTVSITVSITDNNYSTVSPKEKKKYWC